ncbi:MAG: hypothetical protein ACI9WU_001209, partial [Myxococcota bacterium]
GKTTRGKELIKRSLLLYNRQAANEYAYSVDVRNIYEHAKREIAEQATGTIEVRSTPDSAEVYLDGTFKGYTPTTLSNTSAGSHLVEVSKDGYLRWSTAAVVPEGGRVPTEAVLTASPVQSELKTALAKLARSMKPKRFGAVANSLAGVVNAKEIFAVTAAVGTGGFELQGFYMDLAGNVQPIKATIAQDAQFYANIRSLLSATLQAAFSADGRHESLGSPPKETVDSVMKESQAMGGDVVIDPNSPLFKVEEKDKGDSITSKWWFWTIVGVGTLAIAGTVIGVVIATSDDDGAGGAVGDLNITIEDY